MFIKFNNDSRIYRCEVEPIGTSVVSLKFERGTEPVVNTSGFHAFADMDMELDIGGTFYESFRTVYRNDDETGKFNGYQLSSTGRIYSGEAFPDETEPTVEELQDAKIAEMLREQQKIIAEGVVVKLTNGETEKFSMSANDQISLIQLAALAQQGTESIPWHTADESVPCKYYSAADMAIITTAALKTVTYHVTYFRDLRIYIRSLESAKEIKAIYYGISLPEDFLSDVLRDLLKGGQS